MKRTGYGRRAFGFAMTMFWQFRLFVLKDEDTDDSAGWCCFARSLKVGSFMPRFLSEEESVLCAGGFKKRLLSL